MSYLSHTNHSVGTSTFSKYFSHIVNNSLIVHHIGIRSLFKREVCLRKTPIWNNPCFTCNQSIARFIYSIVWFWTILTLFYILSETPICMFCLMFQYGSRWQHSSHYWSIQKQINKINTICSLQLTKLVKKVPFFSIWGSGAEM